MFSVKVCAAKIQNHEDSCITTLTKDNYDIDRRGDSIARRVDCQEPEAFTSSGLS